MDTHIGLFKNTEEGLETLSLFLVYDLPAAAQPWTNLNDGDVLNFFFEENGINIARIVDDKLAVGICVREAAVLKVDHLTQSNERNVAEFKTELTRRGSLNLVVLHSHGGCSMVVNHGIEGRYRVTYHEILDAAGTEAARQFIEDVKGVRDEEE